MRKVSNSLKIIPLGGVEEIGINCTAYEYNNEIVVVDMGLGFPENSYYGVDYVVPDVSYVAKQNNKIKGLVITHGHLDHIGALPYLLPMLNFPPIYGTEFTIELIKNKLVDKKIDINKVSLNIIDEKSKVDFKNFHIEFFRVNHSIPQCVGVYLQVAGKKIVQTGDFKFDNSPVNEPVADYARIARIGEEGIDLLLSDSTNSLKKGHPISESDVAKGLTEIVEKAKGRVIVATFSGLVGRLYQLLAISEKLHRKVAIGGFSMNQTIKIAQQIGYIKVPDGLVVDIKKINHFAPNHTLILTTGAQGEPNAALFKMASEDYKGIEIKPGDSVIISSGTVAGNQRAVQKLTDMITKKGAIVFQSEDMDLFTSGHGYQEDQKIMLNLIKPKYFMPVHGYQYFLRAHAETAKAVGIKPENIIIASRGSVIEADSTGFKTVGKIKCEPLLISGSGIGDIGSVVLKEREQLGNYGVVVITMSVDKDTFTLKNRPFIQTRGFVYVKSSKEIIDGISEIAENAFTKASNEKKEISEIREAIIDAVSNFVFKETEREPMIVPIVSMQ